MSVINSNIQDFQEELNLRIARMSEAQSILPVEKEVKESDSSAFERQVAIKKALSDIPLRYKEVSFDSFKERSPGTSQNKKFVMAYANKLVKDYRGNLVMCGAVGTGKTHLAISTLRHYVESQQGIIRPVGYTTLNDLFLMSKTFGDLDTKKRLSHLVDTDLLVIDEVNGFITQMSEFDKATLFDVFNKRYNAIRPTVVISNLNPDQLEKALGLQVLSRLFQDSKNILVFNDTDFRQAK
jgi:DNA replication protein DnaC